MPENDNVRIYDANAPFLADYYSRITTEQALPFLTPMVQTKTGKMLDIGSGAGRDSFWFAERGWSVDAMDGSVNLLAEAKQRHPHDNIDYYADTVPDFPATRRKGRSYDLIVMSAFLFHFDEKDRAIILKNCADMLLKDGLIHLTLRCGPLHEGKNIFLIDIKEIENYAARYNLSFKHHAHTPDNMGREDISWDHVSLWRGTQWTQAMDASA